MLKLEDFIKEFPSIEGSDRDVEIPSMLEFLKIHPVDSLLDIGAHSSGTKYAPQIRPLIKKYDGIDILNPMEEDKILDNFYTGNAIEYSLEKHDMVICLSSIEHAGISTYKGDYIAERMNLFKRCLELANKYLWISFPVGQKYTYPGELSIITNEQLYRWEELVSSYKLKERFFYTQGAPVGHPWYEHTKREVAVKIPFIDFIGTQSICIMEIEK